MESYVMKRSIIVLGSIAGVYIAYAIIHALAPAFGPLAAGAAGYGAGIVAHRYWAA